MTRNLVGDKSHILLLGSWNEEQCDKEKDIKKRQTEKDIEERY
jgi:hypothetical protein